MSYSCVPVYEYEFCFAARPYDFLHSITDRRLGGGDGAPDCPTLWRLFSWRPPECTLVVVQAPLYRQCSVPSSRPFAFVCSGYRALFDGPTMTKSIGQGNNKPLPAFLWIDFVSQCATPSLRKYSFEIVFYFPAPFSLVCTRECALPSDWSLSCDHGLDIMRVNVRTTCKTSRLHRVFTTPRYEIKYSGGSSTNHTYI